MSAIRTLTAALLFAAGATMSQADTVTIKVGYSAGGGTDARARLIAQHLGDYLDGEVDVVVSNVPGAGSAKLMRMLVTTEPNDGSVIAMVSGSMPVSVALRDELADIDMTQVHFITTLENQPRVCVVRSDLGIETLEDFRTGTFRLGATGRSSATYVYPATIKRALDANFDIVTGFNGAADVNAAILRGEIAGRCAMEYDTIVPTFGDLEMTTIIQIAAEGSTLVDGVPSLLDEIEDPLDREAVAFLFTDTTFFQPILLAPGTSEEIVMTYRKAFREMLADADFQAGVAALNRTFSPRDGSEAEAWVRSMKSASPEVLQRAKELAQ